MAAACSAVQRSRAQESAAQKGAKLRGDVSKIEISGIERRRAVESVAANRTRRCGASRPNVQVPIDGQDGGKKTSEMTLRSSKRSRREKDGGGGLVLCGRPGLGVT